MINPSPDVIRLNLAEPGALLCVVECRFSDVSINATGQNERDTQPLWKEEITQKGLNKRRIHHLQLPLSIKHTKLRNTSEIWMTSV